VDLRRLRAGDLRPRGGRLGVDLEEIAARIAACHELPLNQTAELVETRE
jgi:hypothetical protein